MMRRFLFLGVIFLSLLLLFSGCITESFSKKVSNENFEFQYLETFGWGTVNYKDPELAPLFKESIGDANIIVILGNETRTRPSAILIVYEETDPSVGKDLNLVSTGTQLFVTLGDGKIDDAKIFSKNNHLWASFRIIDENELDVVMLTYCGPLYIKIFLATSEKYINSDRNKLMEIVDSFHCKIPTKFKEIST